MDVLQFVSSIISSLAWPVTLIVLVWMLRDPIQRVLLTITKLQYKELRVDFGRELKELEKKAEAIAVKPSRHAALPPPERKEPNQTLEDAERLLDVFPEPAVALAWSAVETALSNAITQFAASTDFLPHDSTSIVRRLAEQGVIDSDTADVINRLRNLRYIAVHGGGIPVTTDEVREYLAIARGVVGKLNTLQR